MTVINGARPIVTPRGSVLGAFMPKPRATIQVEAAERTPHRRLRDRLAGRGRQIKDGIVATAATASGCVAAFDWHPWAGFLAIGLSLVFIDHAVDRPEAVIDDECVE
ncbi:MAG TPA: hypothetical protein VHX38_18880 [Pseudonocardiaceae bacterium]|jgi:hypothetical protein|nr:hypothetical protein [Pseudonocardiaceae bacterium]